METSEIELMAAVERRHWWYRGLRDAIRRTVLCPRFRPASRPRILDAGCGTGENLLLLQQVLNPDYIGGFDLSDRAVSLCREKVPRADVYVSDLRNPDLHSGELDLVLSCDAASIAGIDQCQKGFASLVGRLRRGGLFILNLPAFTWLYSDHDKAIETQDRVTAGQVRRLLARLGLSIELVTYRVFLLFPAIVVARIPSICCRSRCDSSLRSDVLRSPAWCDGALGAMLSAENRALFRGIRFPWGSSVYAVGRKP